MRLSSSRAAYTMVSSLAWMERLFLYASHINHCSQVEHNLKRTRANFVKVTINPRAKRHQRPRSQACDTYQGCLSMEDVVYIRTHKASLQMQMSCYTLSHQAAAQALPAQCGRAGCWGTTAATGARSLVNTLGCVARPKGGTFH